MKTIPHYCQSCGASNRLGERSCEKCGTRLMLVVFPPALRHDEGIVPSYYEDHLLERVTMLEIRFSQVTDRLTTALDIMLRQSKNSQSQFLLLETLIDVLNTLGAVEKDKLTQKWRKNAKKEEQKEIAEANNKLQLKKILTKHKGENKELFEHLIKEGVKFLAEREEKQAFRTFEQALQISPENVQFLLFLAEKLFIADKFELAQKQLEKAILIEPKNGKVLFFLGVISADLLQIEKAHEYFEKLPNRLSTTFCVQYVKGLIAASKSDWKTALEPFKLALNSLDLPETNYLVGCVYFQLNKFKTALKYLQIAVEKDNSFADAWFMLAIIYQIIGDETKSFQAKEVAWSVKETGADYLKFAKNRQQFEIKTALPFFRLKDLKKNLIMSSSIRFSKLFRREVSKILSE